MNGTLFIIVLPDQKVSQWAEMQASIGKFVSIEWNLIMMEASKINPNFKGN